MAPSGMNSVQLISHPKLDVHEVCWVFFTSRSSRSARSSTPQHEMQQYSAPGACGVTLKDCILILVRSQPTWGCAARTATASCTMILITASCALILITAIMQASRSLCIYSLHLKLHLSVRWCCLQPAVAFANIGELAIDVLITTLQAQLVARLDTPNLMACVGNNAYQPQPAGLLATAAELYSVPGE